MHYGLSEVVNAGGSRCNIKNCEEINKDVVCFFEANWNFACCLILLFDFSQSGRKSMSDNGDQTNLGQEKIHPSNQQSCSQKRTHFLPLCSKFNIARDEKGLCGSYTY